MSMTRTLPWMVRMMARARRGLDDGDRPYLMREMMSRLHTRMRRTAPVWPGGGRLLLAAGLLAASVGAGAAVRFAPTEQVLLDNTLTETGLLSISQFHWQGRIDDALDDIERQWQGRDALPAMRSRRDGWQLITRLDGEVVETIQLRPAAQGLHGQRIRWTPSASARKTLAAEQAWARALLPRQATLMAPLAHVDGDVRMSTFVAWMDDSVVNPAGWVGRKLLGQGFTLATGPVRGINGVHSALYTRTAQEVLLTTRREGSRQFIVLHWKH